MKIAGLFAGIGGIELGFERAFGNSLRTEMLCEWWEPAQAVLSRRFPDVELHPDVRELRGLPRGLDLLSAGFPCTDLSQAGRTAGIAGAQSGLVSHVFEALRLTATTEKRLPWLMIENVPNMLTLDKGKAMAYLVHEIEALGYRWAYRVVDSRFTGVPQRRRRVILLASATEDPRRVLFADDAGERPEADLKDDAFGFYWTEGRGGLGWAQDAVPTLKGGSSVGIPSPPAIWVPGAPDDRLFVTPSVEDAEEMQGFERGWSDVLTLARRNGPRWKLVGNAVTTRVAEWVAGRIAKPGDVVVDLDGQQVVGRWPTAAWGERGTVHAIPISEFPTMAQYEHLSAVVDLNSAAPLSARAINGFHSRLLQGNLGRYAGFRDDVARYREMTWATRSFGEAVPSSTRRVS
ncbi:DNA (cytosine-5-)-methyltransferase [Luteipulveratus sp. YIM 133132]|uniref:DNA cytosine methyltransferase n=1 Tax=Luteipulveratus flavus TaxID=3031728 RepID=UPI0023AF4560|nr:DNA (cytosine-5-)-methyltransferase [Luteipulveratus sp. YIM 133132]MDE9364525.1 DNA (cytosine-5-)-methyltransferase [Luteipulveratus sp. YIM 133132]